MIAIGVKLFIDNFYRLNFIIGGGGDKNKETFYDGKLLRYEEYHILLILFQLSLNSLNPFLKIIIPNSIFFRLQFL